ncbi:MAG: hypothetical protein U0228_26355 [Myxococcaceae bacterium]
MSPERWNDGTPAGEDAHAAALLRTAREQRDAPVDVGRGWDDVVYRATRPAIAAQVAWFFGAMATGALLTLAVTTPWARQAPVPAPQQVVVRVAPPRAPAVVPAPAPAPVEVAVAPAPVEAPTVTPVVTSPNKPVPAPHPAPPAEVAAWASNDGTRWARLEHGVRLEGGRLEHPSSDAPSRLESRAVVLVSAGRFAAEVTEAGTDVVVYEGTVVASIGGKDVSLQAGTHRFFAVPPSVAALEPQAFGQGDPSCGKSTLEARLTCLDERARGTGLSAEAALYERAWLLAGAGHLSEARAALRDSLSRFPHGAFEPEVRVAMLRVAMADDDVDGAQAAAKAFLAECPDDPRSKDVASWLSTLEYLRTR